MSIVVLMGTYNGAKYFEAQLKSILNQSLPHLKLCVRDDGSHDNTPQLLQKYASEDSRIQILEDSLGQLGAKGNFGQLLSRVEEGEYFFLADQDDLWHPHKLAIMVAKLHDLEAEYGKKPLLLHSDLEGISAEGQTLFNSYWRYAKLNPERAKTFNRLLVQNNVTGAATAFNAALKAQFKSLPPEALMHDAWLALIASAFGHVEALPECLVYYRQHGANVVGAKGYSLLRGLLNWSKKRSDDTFQQAALFLAQYETELSDAHQETIRAYLSRNRKAFFRHGLFKQGFLRNVGYLLQYE